MINLGKYNTLKVLKELDFGIYLDGEEFGEILMPKRYVPENTNIDDSIEAFIYFDSEDRIIATTEKPLASVGDFANLKVKSVNNIGAFLDWGLPKDLLVPFREQKVKMEEGRSYIVYIYVDYTTKRIAASAKLDKHLDNLPPKYEPNQEVDLLIHSQTDIGFKAIINNLHWGVLYQNEVFTQLQKGQKIKGYIKKIRDDEKIDLMLQLPGFEKIDDVAEVIIEQLQRNKGVIYLSDKSPAEDIYQTFKTSKKTFKKALGALYKERKIKIEEDKISLI
jgi:uncharacterized protein